VTSFSYRAQRTIAGPAEVSGTGFLTGATVRLRFLPGPPNTGIVFVRTDLPSQPRIPALIDNVTGTERRTTLGKAPVQVGLVEHVMAALAGMRIDNCIVELNAPEPPGLDGSAGEFVRTLRQAGLVLQAARRPVWKIEESVVLAGTAQPSSGVGVPQGSLAIHPTSGQDMVVTYFLDYGQRSPIARQVCTHTITPTSFFQELATSRTFLLEAEALELRRQGLGSQTTVADLLVFGPNGPIGNRLRFANEPARHKALDIVGDLALLGIDLVGHVVACRTGHPHNAALVRALQQQMHSACGTGRQAA
jgi:UDP-3-O-[3-hydroxymyristoyl] N-acetylglucosamine deacetylase